MKGNPFIKIIIVGIIIFCSTSSLYAQKQFKEAKAYLLQCCIISEYNNIDSNNRAPYNKDYSGSYYVQMTNLPLPLLSSLHTYYKDNIASYRGFPKEGSHDAVANMACWSCIRLVEAKATKKFLKKSLKKKYNAEDW